MLKELKLKPTLNLNGNDKKAKDCTKKGMVEGLRFELHNGENPRFRYSTKDDGLKKVGEEPRSIHEFSTCYEKVIFVFGLLISVLCGFFHPTLIKLYGDFLTLLIGRFTEGYVIEVPKLTGFLGAGQWRPNLTHDEQMEFLIQDVKAYTIVSFTAGVSQFVFSYLMILFLSYFALKKVGRMKEYFLESLIQQEVSWHDQQNSGSGLASAMAELDTLKNGFNENLGMVIYLTSTFVVNVLMSLFVAWKLTLILIAVAVIFVGIAALCSRQKGKLFLKESESCKQAIGIAYEVLSSIRTVTAFGGEEKEANRFEKQSLNAQKLSVRISIFSGLGNGVTWMLMYLYYTTCMWWATPHILADRTKLEKEYSPGTVSTALFCMTIGIINIGLISPYIESLVKARIAANNIYKVLNRKSKINPFSNDGKIVNGTIGTIEFRNVHFNYPTRPNVKVLQGLDLKINQGESVALVGPSGCGKSTTIQLLERFYDPDSGSVLLDGIDVRELRLSWLRRQIGLVGQEPVLFNTTVAKNICGDLNISYEDMVKAAKEANVHEFISSLPQGYDTMVGEGGSSFSGGQKQRIAIARALVRNPSILLLDEATSALDVASEAIVQNALDKASKGRTSITVAHRLSSIQNADRIIVIHEGRVIEEGTHTQLMEKQGKYYSLVSADANLQGNLKNKAVNNVNNNIENPADILLEPNLQSDKVDDIVPVSTSRPSWRRLWQLNKPELWYIVFGSIGALFVGITSPVNALLFGTYNAALSNSDENYVLEVSFDCALYFLLLAIFTFLSMFMQFSLLGTAGARLTSRLRNSVFASMLKQEMTWFDDDRNGVGVLTTRLNSDTNTVQDATGSKLGAMMQAVGTLIIGATISLFYSWKMTLACLLAVPVICASLAIESTIASKANNKTRHYIEQASKVAIEAMSNIRTIASLNLESHVLKRFNKRLTESRKSEIFLINIRGVVFALGYSAVNLSYSLTIAYSVYLIIKEDVPYVNTIIVAETILYGTWLVCQLLTLAPNVSAGREASGRLFSIIDRKPQLYNPPNDTGKLNSSGDVAYSEVQFAYPKRLDTIILKGLDLKIVKGQTIALVGLSGSGKSTCVQLLQRFYDPMSGTISINGQDITQVSLHRLRAELGIVSQEPVLFDRTISENIAYGDNSRDVPLTEIIDAAKKANVHEFISSLPAGYETRLGSRGMQLSGGQKQRIAIARALIRNPSILILDEATSALDTQNEKIVQEALETAMKGRTCIMIAHRLSTVQRCDVIYVMSNGEVVESGSHSELLQLNNHYAQLLKQQS